MTKDELIQHRERARPRIIHAWQRRNPNVRIRQMTYHNPNYYVTSDGRVYCLHTIRDEQGGVSFKLESRKLEKATNKGAFAGGSHNYLRVKICISVDNAKNFPTWNLKSTHYWAEFKVHRLVARYFCSQEFFDRTEVDHLDGNPVNNNDFNLEWVTPEENRRRAVAMRRARKREKEININRKKSKHKLGKKVNIN